MNDSIVHPGEATHWTGRAMAKACGISLGSVQRIWSEHRLQPHRLRTFKRSNDPAFADKLRAVVGLYVELPAHAVVLSLDEKSQIQPAQQAPAPSLQGPMPGGIGGTLDRTHHPQQADDPAAQQRRPDGRRGPGLPIKPGKCGTMTHDYKRHGTTTLFAALNVLDSTVIGRCPTGPACAGPVASGTGSTAALSMARHRHQEFIRFLNTVERTVPPGKLVHVILDNHGSHKHPKVRAWLERHPRWSFHFTPTSGSPPVSPDTGRGADGSIASCDRWLNAVETFFSTLTRRRIRRGVFGSIVDVQAAINRYLNEHSRDPKSLVWTRTPDAILDKLHRAPAVPE